MLHTRSELYDHSFNLSTTYLQRYSHITIVHYCFIKYVLVIFIFILFLKLCFFPFCVDKEYTNYVVVVETSIIFYATMIPNMAPKLVNWTQYKSRFDILRSTCKIWLLHLYSYLCSRTMFNYPTKFSITSLTVNIERPN